MSEMRLTRRRFLVGTAGAVTVSTVGVNHDRVDSIKRGIARWPSVGGDFGNHSMDLIQAFLEEQAAGAELVFPGTMAAASGDQENPLGRRLSGAD